MVSPRSRATRLAAAGAVAACVLLPGAAAFAADDGQCPAASPSDTTCNPAPSTAATGARQTAGEGVQAPARQNRGGLPVTGADIVGITVVGVGALTAGGVLAHRGRRRTTDA